ncbi:MAG: response regulator [Pseudomonadota bacterium]
MSENAEQAMVFVVDDDESMRDSIRLLLESEHLNASTFSCALDFMQSCNPRQGGCLLLDVRMPGLSGMELLEALKASGILLPVIMISGHGDVPMAVRALKHGAFDFIQKPFNSRELLERIHAALELDQKNRRQNSENEQRLAIFMTLTDREMEVVDLVVAGNPSKIIAKSLGISPKTVDIHRANIMRKLDVHTVAEMVQLRLSVRDI